MMILAGDVGGTKINLGLSDGSACRDDPRAAPVFVHKVRYASADYAGLEDAIGQFLRETGQRAGAIAAACVGIAGPVRGNRIQTPNLPWVVDGDAVAARFKIEAVELINDLAATGEGVASLQPKERYTLQPGRLHGDPTSRFAGIVAAGTGLGMALLVPQHEQWVAAASEGGHVSLAARNDNEIGLLRYLAAKHSGHVSVERVVSGPGLLSIYQYLVEDAGMQPAPHVDAVQERSPSATPAEISACGVKGECRVCSSAIKLFASFYGAVCGDLALTLMATGGVFLGGGIAPKILPALESGAFVEAFCDKGRHRRLMEQIPIRVILNPETALLGAARRAARTLCPASPTRQEM